MQPYVPVPNVIQAQMRQTLGGEQLMTTNYFRVPAPVTVAQMGVVGAALVSWWDNSLSAFLSSNLQLNEVYLTDLTSQSGATLSVTSGLPAVGSLGVEAMSNNVAACISFKTASRGRSFQGRNYIAGLAENTVLLNIIGDATRFGLRAAYEEMLAWSGTIGATPVVVSRYSGYTIVGAKKIATPRVVGIATNITTYKFTTTSVRTQRNRLPN